MSAALLALVLLAAPESSSIEAGVFSGSPTFLQTGMVAGPSLELGHSIGALLLGGRFRLGFVEENDLSFQVANLELRPELFGGGRWSIGRGELRLSAGLGPVFVREARTRLQASRLPDTETTVTPSWATALLASADLGVRVFFYEAWSIGVMGGPSVFVSSAEEPFRIGWSGSLLVGYSQSGASLP